MRMLILLALALPAAAGPVAPHPFPWITGERMLAMLNDPAQAPEAVGYLKGVVDATADRQWCYRATKPGSAELQAALTDRLRALAPPAAQVSAADLAVQVSAADLAVQAWRAAWPCVNGCCHG